MEFIKSILHPGFVWAVAGLFLLLAELAIPGLIVFFFGVGALLTALVCWIADISINQQMIIFLVSSLCSLFLLRRWLKGVFKGHTSEKQSPDQNLDSFTGQRVTVKETIAPGKRGRVVLNGTDWSAESDEELSPGDTAIVVSQASLTLNVSKQA